MCTCRSGQNVSIENGPLPSLPKHRFACFDVAPFAEVEAALIDAAQPGGICSRLGICASDVGVHQLCLQEQ